MDLNATTEEFTRVHDTMMGINNKSFANAKTGKDCKVIKGKNSDKYENLYYKYATFIVDKNYIGNKLSEFIQLNDSNYKSCLIDHRKPLTIVIVVAIILILLAIIIAIVLIVVKRNKKDDELTN